MEQGNANVMPARSQLKAGSDYDPTVVGSHISLPSFGNGFSESSTSQGGPEIEVIYRVHCDFVNITKSVSPLDFPLPGDRDSDLTTHESESFSDVSENDGNAMQFAAELTAGPLKVRQLIQRTVEDAAFVSHEERAGKYFECREKSSSENIAHRNIDKSRGRTGKQKVEMMLEVNGDTEVSGNEIETEFETEGEVEVGVETRTKTESSNPNVVSEPEAEPESVAETEALAELESQSDGDTVPFGALEQIPLDGLYGQAEAIKPNNESGYYNSEECREPESDSESENEFVGIFVNAYQPEGNMNDDGLSFTTEKSDTEGDEFLTDSKPYKMVYCPLRLRLDGVKTLIHTSQYLTAQKFIDKGDTYFMICIQIRNISSRPITFRIRTCDESKYEVEPPYGILKRNEMINSKIRTRLPEWSFIDLMNDSVQILASAFSNEGQRDEKCVITNGQKVAQTFWKRFGTPEFPSAEEHVIRQITPFEHTYLSERSKAATVSQLCQQKITYNWFSFIGKYTYIPEIKPPLDEFQRKMMYGDCSEDPGDIFIRDQARCISENKTRNKEFSHAHNYNLKNLFVHACVCGGLTCIILLVKLIPMIQEAKNQTAENCKGQESGLFNFWPLN